ncbi:MAG TPA: sulfotransferase [Candidatus Krumholzibacteria bacterium]|nr:sulfotransferase [Candidatus Krumholzibacteria bacterium]
MPERVFYVVLSTQRSGSTWFRRMLDSHPEIRDFGEIFLLRPWEGWRAEDLVPFSHHLRDHGGRRPAVTARYLRRLRESPTPAKAVGFKLMYGQLARFPELLPLLLRHRFRLIHLVRDNHLDMVISRERDERLKITHTREKVEVPALHLDPVRLRQRLRRIGVSVRAGRGLTAVWPHPVCTVRYEDLAADPSAVLRPVVEFLGQRAEGVELQSRMQRIATGTYRDRIANYDEIAPLLREWGYGGFLGEQGRVSDR